MCLISQVTLFIFVLKFGCYSLEHIVMPLESSDRLATEHYCIPILAKFQ